MLQSQLQVKYIIDLLEENVTSLLYHLPQCDPGKIEFLFYRKAP